MRSFMCWYQYVSSMYKSTTALADQSYRIAFHCNGPFDAYVPSRSRHNVKAPVLAWSDAAANRDAFATARGIPNNTHYNLPYPHQLPTSLQQRSETSLPKLGGLMNRNRLKISLLGEVTLPETNRSQHNSQRFPVAKKQGCG